MTQPPAEPTIQRTHLFRARCYASRNDGTHLGDVIDMRVEVSTTVEPISARTDTIEALGRVAGWVDTYLNGHDLTAALDFAPTADRIAVWIARVAELHLGERFAAVAVQMGADVATVIYRD